MSQSSSNFYKPFIFVLGALVLLTFFLAFIANMMSPDSPDDPLVLAEIKKSIAPVGRSRVVEMAKPDAADTTESMATQNAQDADDTAATEAKTAEEDAVVAETTETEAAETEAAGSMMSATKSEASMSASLKVKAVVATNCAGCHNDGLHGAALVDDASAWSGLSEKGIDALTASVINGKGKMPARAESTLTDAEIRQAVELMIANATGSAPEAMTDSTAGAEAPATAATETAGMAMTSTAATEIPAAVKQVVDTACSACHLTGVAGAPKPGDKEAWAPRVAKGIDALVASSIAGIGIMPPRGGASLDDEQMRLAIEYMLSK